MKFKFQRIPYLIKNEAITGIIRIMKISFIFLFIFSFQLLALNTKAQDAVIELKTNSMTVGQLINEIEKQTDYLVVYSNREIDANREVSLLKKSDKVSSYLDEAFAGTDISYDFENNYIVLLKKANRNATAIADMIRSAQQQGKTITGKVVDANGEPIIGANIIEVGTTNGTVTDIDGNFSLKVADNATIRVSYIGYVEQEIKAAGKTSFNITLVEDTQALEEVVVVGYGTQSKITVTGSVVSTKGEELVKSQTPNVMNAMIGHLPGVIINNRTGEPGKDTPDIFIRGKSTTGTTNPLILIDGIEREDLSLINSNDIESISVLKDASAAIYGARAANGVILVTTKRGTKGAPKFDFTFNQGFAQPTRSPKMADSYTFAKVYNEIEIGEGRTAKYSDSELEKFKIGKEPFFTTTNWYDVMIRNLTPQYQANLAVSGGSDVLDYYISIGKIGQEGHFNYGSTKVDRYNFRSNINVKTSQYIQFGLDLSGRLDDKHYPGNPDTRGIYSHIFLYQPNWTLFWPGTKYPRPNRSSQSLINWVSDKAGWQDDIHKALETKLHFNIDIPWVEGLSFSGSAAYDTGNNFIKYFIGPSYVYYYDEATDTYTEGRAGDGPDLAQLNEHFDQSTRLTFNALANYNKKLFDHNIDVMLGYEQMEYNDNYLEAARTDFPSNAIPELIAGSSDKNKQSNEGSSSKTARQNYFGRVTYDYAGKYLAQFIFRYDGSPNFPENKRWGFFPGVSLGWRISEEAFMERFTSLDNLKIRGSYGEMGNDAVPPFQYLASYEYGNNYVIGNNDVIGLIQSGVPNPNITWEVAKSTNVGMELSLWKGAMAMEFDLFKTRRSNILTKRTAITPDYTGLTLPDENIGIVENRGFELQLSHNRRLNSDFRYLISGNLSWARNKVIFADEAPAAEEYQMATGRPIGAQLLYKAIGIFRSQSEIDNTPHMPGARPGDIIYEDVNKDGELNSRDMIRINETATPEIVYSINASLKYKNVDLSIMFQGQENAKTYFSGQGVDNPQPYFAVMSYNLGNFLSWRAQDRWSPENTDASQPRGSVENFNNNTLPSTHWLMDAGFLRLKNLEIGYSIPSAICKNIGLSSLRAYVSGNNLAILYDHMKNMGFDPETVDFWFYEQQRTFNIGINLTF